MKRCLQLSRYNADNPATLFGFKKKTYPARQSLEPVRGAISGAFDLFDENFQKSWSIGETIARHIERTMPRKLKTYTTSAGFFDLAIAAPSMKAALEAWGSESNLFHQGFAKLSDDPEIVADTMARPGVVLRRPVGTDERFSEHAELPSNFLAGNSRRKPEKAPTRKDRPASRRIDEKTTHQAAFAFEEEQRRR